MPQFLDTYDKNNDTRYTDCWIGGVQQDQSGNTIYVDGQPLNYTYEIRSTDNPGCYPMEGYRLVKYEIRMVTGAPVMMMCLSSAMPMS